MQKFCQNCGAELKENSSVCLECGRTVVKTYHHTSSTSNNGLAVAGFIVSLVSLFINLAGLVGLAGAILSGVGLAQIRSNGEKGKGMAIAGLIVGIFSVLYGLYAISTLLK